MTDQEKIIANFFVEREGDGIIEYIREIDFMEEGILDSLDIVTLAAYIEKNTNINLDITNDEVLNALRKFDSIVELISR